MEWNEANRNRIWGDLAEVREHHIEQKRSELGANKEKLESFNRRFEELTKDIASNILSTYLPVKYIAGWQANNTRNSVGYMFAGGGSLAISVAAIFLRLFPI